MRNDGGSIPVSYAHLAALTGRHGIFEHAVGAVPRREGGYCVDDAARALIVVVRDVDQEVPLQVFTEIFLRFLEGAIAEDGSAHNRMSAFGGWTDAPGVGDWWGRLLWALGLTAARARSRPVRERALAAFHRAASARSPALRSMAFATLGAAEVLQLAPNDRPARELAVAGVAAIPASTDPDWPWPEARLAYGNASIAEALIAAGRVLDDPALEERGLTALRFLLAVESAPGHLSVTGVAGRGRGETGPQFDQQPIEVAALADACARAFDVSADPSWLDGIRLAWAWFIGENDSGTVMFDVDRGAGFDGLEPDGRNENQGAESTLAGLSTLQQARLLVPFEPVVTAL
ncbi:MAG TPA: glycosyltransferase [Gryllotalpicola sp.]